MEVVYDLYNPTIKKIETLKLEKRLDNDLSYLVDALPEYSTFDFHMEPQAHPAGTPIPVNECKVRILKRKNKPFLRIFKIKKKFKNCKNLTNCIFFSNFCKLLKKTKFLIEYCFNIPNITAKKF